MSYNNERQRVDEEDARSWGKRVVGAFNAYHKAENVQEKEEAYKHIRELVTESIDFGYDFSYIDPFGVSSFSNEDLDVIRKIKEQMEEIRDGEER